MNDKMKITIEISNTGLEEGILRKGEWEDDSLFGRSLRNALMHFTKESSCIDKIRDEIESYIDKEKLNFGGQFDSGLNLALKIIDKYRTENETRE